MSKSTKLFTLFSILALFVFLLTTPTSLFAQGRGTVVPGPATPTEDWTSSCVDTQGVATLQGFECLFQNLLRVIIPLGGLAVFIVILIGGFQYITSAGDPKQAQKATGMITGAIIGIVVAVGIWFLFQILGAITGLNLLQFAVPG